MNSPNKTLLTLTLLIISVLNLTAQNAPVGVLNVDDLDSLSSKHKRFSPSIYFGTTYYPERHFIVNRTGASKQVYNVSDSTLQYSKYEFSVTCPIVRLVRPDGTHQINLYASGSWNDFDVNWFTAVHSLYSANAGLQYLYYQPKENLFLFHFTAGFANDQYYLLNQDEGLRYSGLALFNRLKNPRFQYFAGLATTVAFKNTLFIPLIGGKLKIGAKDFIRVSLPLSKHVEYYPFRVAYYHPLSRRTMVFGQFENSGNSYRIYSANEEKITANTASVQLREVGRTFGVGLRFRLRNNLRFQFELNNYYNNNQVLSLGERESTPNDKAISSLHLQSGLILQGSLMWNINYQKNKKSATPRVNYLDIQNIDVEDLPDDFQ